MENKCPHGIIEGYNYITRETTSCTLCNSGVIKCDNNKEVKDMIRTFESGATRNSNTDKYDYSGFNSPLVMKRFAEYMHKHRKQADGTLRSSSNWKKGIDRQVYMESMFRHFYDVWALHESGDKTITREDGEVVDMEEALCGLLFNVNGYLFEQIKKK